MLTRTRIFLCLNSELIHLGGDLLQGQSETAHAEKLHDELTQSWQLPSLYIACLVSSQDMNKMWTGSG